MKSNLKLLFCFLVIASNGIAQSISPNSLNSGGVNSTQTNGSLNSTVGELVVLTFVDSQGNTINGGFFAGATLITVNIQEPDASLLSVNVFPNPTTDLINIKINHTSLANLFLTVSDMQGKEVFQGKFAGVSNLIGINASSFAAGNYILSLQDSDRKSLGVYKIIKH
jgi:hypothetical protein